VDETNLIVNQDKPQIQVQTETIKVTATGILKHALVGDGRVSVDLTVVVPKGLQNYDNVIPLIEDAVRKNGGLSTKINERVYHFYPIDLFRRFEFEFGYVTGITL
jgi:hypothetical protein